MLPGNQGLVSPIWARPANGKFFDQPNWDWKKKGKKRKSKKKRSPDNNPNGELSMAKRVLNGK